MKTSTENKSMTAPSSKPATSLEHRVAELEALVARIAAAPRIKSYLRHGNAAQFHGYPSEDLIAPTPTFPEVAKSQAELEAEAQEAAALAEFEAARLAVARVTFPASERGAVLSVFEGQPSYITGVEAAQQNMAHVDKSTPEYAVMDVAEKKLVHARVKLWKLQKARERQSIALEEQRNPSNPSGEKKQPGVLGRVAARLAPGQRHSYRNTVTGETVDVRVQ
jgi:hypothetical protein